MFNLDRFRFDKTAATTTTKKEDSGSKSPESEKENKPAQMKPVKVPPKSHARGVVFEEVLSIDLDEDDLLSDKKTKISLTRKSNPTGKSSKNVESHDTDTEDNEVEDKVCRLLEMFPQLTRTMVLEVIGSTSTLDGAVAVCLSKFGDKEAPDQGRKRKQDGSSSSHQSGEDQPNKKRRTSVVSDDEEDNERNEPSWEKQEAMVRRLQKKFPDQDKEELRMVLQEHDWNVEDALQVLQMFSDPDNTSFSSPETEEKKSTKSKSKDKSSRDHRKLKRHKDHGDNKKRSDHKDHRNDSETEESRDDTDATKDSEDSDSEDSDGSNKKSRPFTLSSWLIKSPDPVSSSSSVKKTTTSSSLKPSSSSSTAQMLSKFASGTSIAKKQAAESKRKARAADEHVSSEGENDDEEDTVSSEFENSDDELDSKGGMTELKKEIIKFFQNASIDELSLISGCSVKKAQKIVELRPFDSWESLVDVFHKDNGLSEDLLLGSRVVLKERKVVLGLMSKCETISSKMVKQVTEVMEKGTGTMKQPHILNSQFQLKPYQLIGLKWLLLLHEHKLSGILADEMGL
ncbi:SWI/SNF-related matrix-associated actin-dependent regulator of chromatin subfamily A containing DEAD/H box 1A-like, partial [Morone saxatilis]|uniref:SWI/SNF-related matrix-associated actin-dependent regulator of chromatin subfamily A containing DEAD/H box 1A-like n=1 Tax=Morone saxatilis TaxID=34816 RepID=UPI0015E2403D